MQHYTFFVAGTILNREVQQGISFSSQADHVIGSDRKHVIVNLRPGPPTATLRHMSSHAYHSHLERTAASLRSKDIYRARLTAVSSATPNMRIFILTLLDPFSRCTFRAGQWLDIWVPSPSVTMPGGFTVISPPALLPSLQLAIQVAPQNPPAVWLFQDEFIIKGQELMIRFGGNFTFPPSDREIDMKELEHVVFIAGGVGINPLLSMLQHFKQHPPNEKAEVSFLFSTKPPVPEPYMSVISALPLENLQLFITADGEVSQPHHRRRMTVADISAMTRGFSEEKTLVYICGPPLFTDRFSDATGVPSSRVLTEKWW